MQLFPFLNDAIDGSTFLLLVVLFVLGMKLVDRDATLQVLGKQLALGAFFLFVAILTIDRQPTGAEAWVAIILRSLIFSGIVLGAAWTILPAGAFVYAQTFGALFRSYEDWSKAAGLRAEEREAKRERCQREAEWERHREVREAAISTEAVERVNNGGQKAYRGCTEPGFFRGRACQLRKMLNGPRSHASWDRRPDFLPSC